MELSAEEARVLGSLVEKELTTPQQYPLTMASLVSACNQSSNRDPVVNFDEEAVLTALEALKERRLVRYILPSHGRSVIRYRHVVEEALGLDVTQRALLSVLLLRGPQTVGELRTRTDRMAQFDGLGEVEHELHLMASLTDPLAVKLARRPGQKEERWECPCVPTRMVGTLDGAPTMDTDFVPSSPGRSSGDRLLALQSELDELRSEVDELRRDMEALRASLGG